MENLFFYLLKSSGLLVAFYLAYFLLLRKETFFNSNRWFLLLGLATSVILPLVTFEKVIFVEASPKLYAWNKTATMITPIQEESFEINWYLILGCIYGLGLLVLLCQFLFDFRNLKSLIKGKTIQQQADFKYIDVNEKVAPFSYFNYIVYNSNLFDENELQNILAHEQVHCEQKHSIDVMVSRLFCIVFWYNPMVWLYKKVMLQNLEFIADSVALKNISDKKSYQITLLKVTTHQNCVAITNPFYQSLIKKRIVMLNKNQSKKWNSWKYALIVPVLIGFLLYFQVNVIAQERQGLSSKVDTKSAGDIAVVIDKNTTDAELKSKAASLKSEGVTLKFSKVKRNPAGEIIAIKAEYKNKDGRKGISQISGDEPIKPLRFFKNDDGAIGFGEAKQIRIFKKGNPNSSDNNAEEIEIYTDIVEAPERPERPERPEATEAPEPPEPPMPADKVQKVIIKKIKDKNGKITMTVNGETIDIDVDKIVDEALASVNFDFDFNTAEIDEEAKEHMKRAKIEMEKVRPNMERAKREMERRRPEMEDAKQELLDAKREMEDARREMLEARIQLEQSRKELEQQKAQLQKNKKTK
jgi:hypothetical protein